MAKVIDGEFLFKLKDTHGFPLEVAIDRISECGGVIDWIGFTEAARKAGWWDYQTDKVITHAMIDADRPKDERERVRSAFIHHVMNNQHPKMKEAA